jgi:hypothetical protein
MCIAKKQATDGMLPVFSGTGPPEHSLSADWMHLRRIVLLKDDILILKGFNREVLRRRTPSVEREPYYSHKLLRSDPFFSECI